MIPKTVSIPHYATVPNKMRPIVVPMWAFGANVAVCSKVEV